MKAIYICYDSVSGDRHDYEIAIFTTEHYSNMEKIFSEIISHETPMMHFYIADYEPAPVNPTSLKEIPGFTKAENQKKHEENLQSKIPDGYEFSSVEPPET